MRKGHPLFSFLAALLFIGVLSLSPGPVKADPLLDFNIAAPTSGTISYAGGAAPLIGKDIQVDTLIGLGTPTNDHVQQVLNNTFLNFTSGNYTGYDPIRWYFGGGGTISISDESTTLLSGTFSDARVSIEGGIFKVAIAGFFDTKDPDLLAFYGLPNTGYYGNFNISFITAVMPPKAFTSDVVLDGDITNTPVPEPGILILLGISMASIAGLRRWWKD